MGNIFPKGQAFPYFSKEDGQSKRLGLSITPA